MIGPAYIYKIIYNSVLICLQTIINSTASAPPNATKIAVKKVSTIQYNTTSFISNIERNNITPTIFSQHWDGWKGGGQKNVLIVVHPQHQLISIVNVK